MKFILCFLLLVQSTVTYAWGDRGHRIVGEIAERHLKACVGRQITELLDGESLAEASTWADDIKGKPEFRHFAPLHFASIQKGSRYESTPRAPQGDVIQGIEEQLRILKESSREPTKASGPRKSTKSQALRLLVHFVGDIHQPLHAGFPEDNGGNLIEVIWFGKRTNLHAVWDTGLLEKLGLSYTELVRFLDRNRKEYPKLELKSISDWADESSALAADAYVLASTNAESAPSQSMLPRLGFKYYDQHIGTAKVRLWQAGRRLALLLNDTIECPTKEEP